MMWCTFNENPKNILRRAVRVSTCPKDVCTTDKSLHWYNFRNRTAERNDCVSFRILQEYDNLRNGTAERTVIGRNGTLVLILCLTLP